MSPEKDNRESIRQETLSQCPYTAFYMSDNTKLLGGPRGYQIEFGKLGIAVDKLIEESFGTTWRRDLLYPQYLWATNLNILLPTMPAREKLTTVQRIFRFGYEMGATRQPEFLQTEIMKKIMKEGYLNPERVRSTNHLNHVMLNGGLSSIMDSGTYFRKNPRNKPNDLSPNIKEFLNGLDLSGLDK